MRFVGLVLRGTELPPQLRQRRRIGDRRRSNVDHGH
jgi:hypothetical protein